MPGDKRIRGESGQQTPALQRSPGDCREINGGQYGLCPFWQASTESRRLPGDKLWSQSAHLYRLFASTESRRLPGDKRHGIVIWWTWRYRLQRSPGDCREINDGEARPAGQRSASTESRRLPGDKPSAKSHCTSLIWLQRSPGDCREINPAGCRGFLVAGRFNGVPAIAGR